MITGGDRGDNTARCECGHSFERHLLSATMGGPFDRDPCAGGTPGFCGCTGYRPVPAADRQTDEERCGDISPRDGVTGDERPGHYGDHSNLHGHPPALYRWPAARPAVADAVMAAPGADKEPEWVAPFYEWARTDKSPGSYSAAFAAGWAAGRAVPAAPPIRTPADLGAAITEGVTEARLREAVAQAVSKQFGRALARQCYGLADAVLALPEMRALRDAAAKVQRVEALVAQWQRASEPPASMVNQLRAALGGEG